MKATTFVLYKFVDNRIVQMKKKNAFDVDSEAFEFKIE